MHRMLVVLAFLGVLAACGGGSSGSPPPTPPPGVTPTPSPIPTPMGTTGFYASSIVPPNGVSRYISDPVIVTFNEPPDVASMQSAITVTPISGNVPTPLAYRLATPLPSSPDALPIRFYDVGGATYRITIGSSARSQSGTPYGGIAQFSVTLPTTPPLPAPVFPVSGSPNFYGVVPQVHAPWTQSQVASWVQQLHAGVVRLGTDMQTLEDSQNQFTYQPLDQEMEAYAAIKVPVLLLITQYNTPGWANGTTQNGQLIPCQPQTYANFVAAVVHHVDTQGTLYPPPVAVELGNEPDTPTFWQISPNCSTYSTYVFTSSASATQYIPFLQAAYAEGTLQAQHDGNKALIFLNAGVASDVNDEAFFDQLVDQASSDEDAWAIHVYAFADPASSYPTRSWESTQVLTDDGAYAAAHGSTKHFWITEGGVQSGTLCPDAVDPATKGYFLAEYYNFYAKQTQPEVDAFTWFSLQDGPAHAGGDVCFGTGQGFGLIDYSGNEEPAFAAFQHLTGAP